MQVSQKIQLWEEIFWLLLELEKRSTAESSKEDRGCQCFDDKRQGVK